MTQEIVNLDEMIEKLFPWTPFAEHLENEHFLKQLYKAYSLGFKDGYGKRNPDAIIQLIRKPTIGETLNATQQEGSQDQGSNAEVLREEER